MAGQFMRFFDIKKKFPTFSNLVYMVHIYNSLLIDKFLLMIRTKRNLRFFSGPLGCYIATYYMASSASGQDEPNRAL